MNVRINMLVVHGRLCMVSIYNSVTCSICKYDVDI